MTKQEAFRILRQFNAAQIDAAEIELALDSSVLPARSESIVSRAREIVNLLDGPAGPGLDAFELYIRREYRDLSLRVEAAASSFDPAKKESSGDIVKAAVIQTRCPLPPKSISAPEVLILTAADVEFETCLSVAGIDGSMEARRRSFGGRTFLDLGLRHCSAWLFQCKKGSLSPGSAFDVVKDALSSLSPKPFAVINVGIAFGLKPKKQHFGDLLLSEQIRLYELQRFGQHQVLRGDRPSSSEILLGWFRDLRVDWALDTDVQLRPRVHVGLLMSGEKLVDNPGFIKQLLDIEPEAVGGDMEAAGVYAATHGEPVFRVHWIVVKGICDWGMGKGDSHQVVAARNAIDLVFHVLDQPVISQALANYRALHGRASGT